MDKRSGVVYRSGVADAGVGQPSERRMMKKLGVSAFLLLAMVSESKAQDNVAKPVFDLDNAAPDFSSTSAAKATLPHFLAVADSLAPPSASSAPAFLAPNPTTALSAVPSPADPAAPSPEPRFVYGGRDDYRWQLSLGFTWFRLRSSIFSSNEFGAKTTVAYFLNEWLGLEGSFTGAFGGSVGATGHDAKLAHYGGGPKVAWRQRRWEPWLHGIFGGAHEGPQTAAGGRNSYSILAGGGADYRWNPHLSYRAEGDYLRTAFFHQTQDDFLFAAGVVIHF